MKSNQKRVLDIKAIVFTAFLLNEEHNPLDKSTSYIVVHLKDFLMIICFK